MDVTREEFDHLKARVDVVEREVEGEKTSRAKSSNRPVVKSFLVVR